MDSGLALTSRYGMRTEEFSALMAYRVRDVLLVASQYDAFVLEEDGQLTELIFEEYRQLDLNLRYAPRFHRASTAEEALELLEKREFQLVVATPRVPGATVRGFVGTVRERYPDLPVGVLAAHAWDLPQLEPVQRHREVEWIFLWQGDVKALLAMIKQVEDRRNADHDVLESGVQAIVLVEDEVRFYSTYLPQIYTEVTTQTSRLMAEGLNLSHRLLRIRARPKILLAQTFEEAWALFERYRGNLLGVITDVSFPREGSQDPEAGLVLARRIRELDPEVPILLQSTERGFRERALEVGAAFLHKSSPNLLHELRRYIQETYGFGDFVFRTPDGTEVARARDLREMVRVLPEVPAESLLYHAQRNHFSRWLKARTEFELASLLRPRKASEFDSPEELRSFLVETLTGYLREIQRHIITDFDERRYDRFVAFAKIGSGSLGGKGRGLAFMHKLLAERELDVPGIEVAIPTTLVLASDVFEDFLHANGLEDLVERAQELEDRDILDAFRAGRFRHERRSELAAFLEHVREPLAVRSSSILEDSLYQPFAGVYATVMLANRHPSLDVRLAQLLEAIKRVYASTFFRGARDYLAATPHRVEEERMAVLVQTLVGSEHGTLYYPTVSGVASSHNHYPFGRLRPEDGVALVALGLGKTVVEGFEAVRFCPAHPLVLPQFSTPADVLRNAQRMFYALDLERADLIPGMDLDANLVRRPITEALAGPEAALIASTYLPEDDTVTSGLARGGTPLVTFASLLRGRLVRLPELLHRLLEGVEEAIGNPVEIEFAMDLARRSEEGYRFHVLQVRPIAAAGGGADETVTPELVTAAVIRSPEALGHGKGEPVRDVIVVDPRRLERSRTAEAALAIRAMNEALQREGRTSVLIGPGRWGSRDPWLGIPVAWADIASARVIVETDFADLEIEPSQGSHFFHNLTCFGVAYLTVHERRGHGRIDWEWLDRQPEVSSALGGAVRHLRPERPLRVVVDGRRGEAVLVPEREGTPPGVVTDFTRS